MHAADLSPTAPWKAVIQEFGINTAVAPGAPSSAFIQRAAGASGPSPRQVSGTSRPSSASATILMSMSSASTSTAAIWMPGEVREGGEGDGEGQIGHGYLKTFLRLGASKFSEPGRTRGSKRKENNMATIQQKF